MATSTGLFANLFNDPSKMQMLGQFFLGLGAGTTQAGMTPGISTLGAVSAGLAQGGQNMINARLLQDRNELLELRKKRLEQELNREERERARETSARRLLFGGVGPTPLEAGFQGAPIPGALPEDVSPTIRAFAQANPEDALKLFGTQGIKQRFEKSKSAENSRIISASDPENEQFDLGIPAGQFARVEFGTDPTTGAQTADVKGRFGSNQNIKIDLGGLAKKEQIKILSDSAKDIREQKTAAIRVVRLANRINEGLDETGSGSLGVVGWVARVGNSVDEQAKAISRASGISLNPEDYSFNLFPQEAIRSAKARSNILALAVAMAKAEEGSRLSDQDVQRALDRIGGSSGSASQMRAALGEVVNDVVNSVDERIVVNESQFASSPIKVPSRLSEDLERLGLNVLPRIEIPPEAAPTTTPQTTPQTQGGATDLSQMSVDQLMELNATATDLKTIDAIEAELRRRLK